MRHRLRRHRLHAATGALLALLALPGTAAADPPANDVRAAATPIELNLQTDLRLLSDPTVDVDQANADADQTDPDLLSIAATGNAQSTCASLGPDDATEYRGTNTVWYRLMWPDEGSGFQPVALERVAIELTTIEANYGNAIAVLRNGVLVHCEAQNVRVGTISRSVVSFVTRPDAQYDIAVIAVSPSDAPDGASRATLAVRAVDLAPPRFSLTASPVLAAPGEQATFEISGLKDDGAGVDRSTITWRAYWRDSGVGIGDPAPSREKTTATITWPRSNPRPGGRDAVVTAFVSDLAGNRSSVSLTLRVKDRTAPRVSLRVLPAGRALRVVGRCSEPSKLALKVARQGSRRSLKSRVFPQPPSRAYVKANRPYSMKTRPLPARAVWLVSARCTDRSGNASVTTLGFFG